MISDDERREVAKRMRSYSHDFDFGDSDPFWYVAKAAFGNVDAHTYYSVFARLADLIDRPTCRICATDHEYEDSVRCDRCRMTFRRPLEPFKYCPNCGAEVKDDSEPNLKEN